MKPTNTTTTIGQSRRLLKLGLDPLTADFAWKDPGSVCPSLCCLGNPFTDRNAALRHGIPAWSLSALLDIMPETIIHNHKDYDLRMLKWYDPELGYIRYEFSYGDHTLSSPRNGFADGLTPVDAACDLLCWLLENNHINQ